MIKTCVIALVLKDKNTISILVYKKFQVILIKSKLIVDISYYRHTAQNKCIFKWKWMHIKNFIFLLVCL